MTDREKIETLIKEELDAANEKHPLFHSPHEAYAVLKEEVDELVDETNWAVRLLDVMWCEVRADEDIVETADSIYKRAIMLIQEGIQVAAMCKKTQDSMKSTLDDIINPVAMAARKVSKSLNDIVPPPNPVDPVIKEFHKTICEKLYKNL